MPLSVSPLGSAASYLIYADVRLHIPMTHNTQAEARMQAMKDAAVNGGGGGGGGGGGDDSEVTKLKEQLVRAEEQNEQMATKIRLVKEGKVKDVDTVEVRWL